MTDRDVLEHKLLKPLTLITCYVGMLQDGLQGALNEKQKETVLKVKEEVKKLTANIRKYVDEMAQNHD